VFWYFLNIDIEKSELLSILGIGAAGGGLIKLLPKNASEKITRRIKIALASKFLTKPLIILNILIFLPASTTTYIEVSWKGQDKINISLNDEVFSLVGIEKNTGSRSTRIYRHAFANINISFNEWSEVSRTYPFTKTQITVPIWLAYRETPLYKEIEDQIRLSFFQFFEARFLDKSKALIATLPSDSTIRPAIERLEMITVILRTDFLGPDFSDNKKLLLQSFETRYPKDEWLPLVRAANSYAGRNFNQCVDSLSNGTLPSNIISTAIFFKGICQLKAGRDLADGNSKNFAVEKSITYFSTAQKALESEYDSAYKDIALPSSILFQGIANYYLERNDEAIRIFNLASMNSTGGIKARALNGAGYIYLSRGMDAEAELTFRQALESDASFAYARSNLGYALMNRGNYKAAKEIFEKNINDERLKSESQRDVILGKLAITHLAELQGDDIDSVILKYASVLAELNMPTYDGMDSKLRLANIHKAVAKNIYLSKNYYGLEIYALVLQAKAIIAVNEMKTKNPNDLGVDYLDSELRNEIVSTKKKVSKDWLRRPPVGWFESLAEISQIAH